VNVLTKQNIIVPQTQNANTYQFYVRKTAVNSAVASENTHAKFAFFLPWSLFFIYLHTNQQINAQILKYGFPRLGLYVKCY